MVIGAGPGGYIAAFRAAQLGLRTIAVEREYVGGVCLNVGCIPSKSLLKNASVMRLIQDAKTYGVELGEVKADYGKAVDRSRDVVKRFVNGVRFLYRKNKVELIEGEARLVGKDGDEITVAVGERQIKTRNVILATGSRPNAFPGMEIDGEVVQNSWQTVVNRERPEQIVIVGGGIISCEMATVFRSYGSQVTILEALPAPPAGDGGADLLPPGAGLQAAGDRVPDRGAGGERQAGGGQGQGRLRQGRPAADASRPTAA